ncbi:dioxygenase [Nocardioides hungaricus]
MQSGRERELVDRVVASFDGAADPRFRELMQSVVRHLHAFVRDVRLTEQEWASAIGFLTDTGQICSGTRQEFILLSDVLGLSMQVVGVNAPAPAGATESTVFGPFFVQGSPEIAQGGNIAVGVGGPRCHVTGRVVDLAGQPVPGARVEIWEADDDGFYDVQYDGSTLRGRGHLFTDALGRYDVWAVLPAAYPIPDDGPVGRLLSAAGRSPMRPAHIHFLVSAAGYRTLITHVFVSASEHLDSDAVFGVKETLLVEFIEHPPGAGPGGHELDEVWYSARFDIVLAPSGGGTER